MRKVDTRRNFLTRAGTLGLMAGMAGCANGTSGGADKTGSSPTSTPNAGLRIGKFVFCDSKPGAYNDYTKRKGAIYTINEVIWIYLDVLGIGSKSADEGEVVYDVSESLTVSGSGGQVLTEEFTLNREIPENRDLDKFFITNDITLPTGSPPGEYTVSIRLEDNITGQTTKQSKPFTIEGEKTGNHRSAFKNSLEEEGLKIKEVIVNDGIVLLSYERTPNRYHEEIGMVAGAFAVQIKRGWEVERLNAKVYDTDKGFFAEFHINRQWAQEFVNEEITGEEYAKRVINTVKRK